MIENQCAGNGPYTVKQNKYVRDMDTTKCKKTNTYMTWPFKSQTKTNIGRTWTYLNKSNNNDVLQERDIGNSNKNKYVQDMNLKQSSTKNE